MKIEATQFIKGIKAVRVAMSKDTTRSSLCLVQVSVLDGRLRFAATDGYRFHVFNVPAEGAPDQEFTLSAATVVLLLRNAQAAVKAAPKWQSVELEFSATAASVGGAAFTYAESTDKGPAWERIVPRYTSEHRMERIGVTASYIIDAAAACALVNAGFVIQGNGACDPITCTAENGSSECVICVIMPRQM